ncbi:MAG: alpha/beta hydrolase family protein [Planctomycetota bacterium]
MKRNFSMIEYFNRKAAAIKPRCRFEGKTRQDFERWHGELLGEVKRLLGPMPEAGELNAEVVWEIEEDGLIKRRVIFDSEADMSVPALLFIPKDKKGKLPAILCNHGHGRFGKDSVMGVRSGFDKRREEEIDSFNYDYGLQMAGHGYITMAIDWRVFGERSDNRDPYGDDNREAYPGRDKCNVQFIRGALMGRYLLALDIFDGMRAIDYLCGLECVDAERIGAMGLSFGGTMTTWISLMDERVKAADIICYSCNFRNFAVKYGNFCGSQIVPGLFEICDVPDLHGLIAPRPLLTEIGVYDKCFLVDDALECADKVTKIYNAAGVSENYEVDLFEGDHAFGGNKAFEFFDKHLKG